mgnify:CR=1 FL=1
MTMEQYLRNGGEWQPGQMVVITAGAWDSYAIAGLYRVNQRVTAEVLEPYFAEPREAQGGQKFRDEYFAAWLGTHGYLQSIPYDEWYMADGYHATSVTQYIEESGAIRRTRGGAWHCKINSWSFWMGRWSLHQTFPQRGIASWGCFANQHRPIRGWESACISAPVGTIWTQ